MYDNAKDINLNICCGCMRELPKGQKLCPNCGFNNSVRQNQDDLLPEGTVLSRKYLIGKTLGRGGFGVTYLGYDLDLQLKVAIKEYFPISACVRLLNSHDVQIRSSAGTVDAFSKGCEVFLDEARTLAKFNTPYVVHVRDFFREHGTAYIVMDFLAGRTLREEVRRNGGKLPPQRVLALMNPLMTQLSELHEQSIIHRDIKPDNMMLVNDWNGEHLVLLDFGAARAYVSDETRTMTGIISQGYSPLEQYSRRSRQGPYTDVYALCATMYYAMTGAVPPPSIERNLDGMPLKPIRKYGVPISEPVESAILHGLALKSADRTQSVKQLQEEIKNSSNAAGETDPPPQRGNPNPGATQGPKGKPTMPLEDMINVAKGYDSTGNYQQEILILKSAADLYPQAADVHNLLGIAYRAIGDSKTAIDEYQKALFLEPENAVIIGNRAVALMFAGKPEESYCDFERSLPVLWEQKNAVYPTALANFASLIGKNGDRDNALSFLQEASAQGYANTAAIHQMIAQSAEAPNGVNLFLTGSFVNRTIRLMQRLQISRKGSARPKTGSSAIQMPVGVAVADQQLWVTCYYNGDLKLLYSTGLRYTDKRNLFLDSLQFGNVAEKVLKGIHAKCATDCAQIVLSIPDCFGYAEICRIRDIAAQHRLKIAQVISESCAAALYVDYSEKFRDKEAYTLFFFNAIDHLKSMSYYEAGDGVIDPLGTFFPDKSDKGEQKETLKYHRDYLTANKTYILKYLFSKRAKVYLIGDQAEAETMLKTVKGMRVGPSEMDKLDIRSLKSGCIAFGAGLMGAIHSKELEDVVILCQTSPYDLCVCLDGATQNLIERETAIPTRKAIELTVQGTQVIKLREKRGANSFLDLGSCIVSPEKNAVKAMLTVEIDARNNIQMTVADQAGTVLGTLSLRN